MPFRRKKTFKRGRRPTKRSSRRTGTKSFGSRRRGGRGRSKASNKIQSEISIMKKITEPLTWSFAWGIRYYQLSTVPYGNSLYFPLLQWNDCFDISYMHNMLKVVLNTSFAPGPLAKFAIGDYMAEFMLKNMSNVEVSIDFYRWTVRQDGDLNLFPQTQWGSSTSPVYFADPSQIAFQGLNEQGITGVTARGWPIGISPFDVARWMSFIKIVKVTKAVVIMGGSFKRFRVMNKRWHIWNGTKVFGCGGATPTNNSVLGGKTGGIFAIATGMPIADSINTNRISTAHVNLACMAKERYMYTGVNNNIKTSNLLTDFGTVMIGSTMNYATEQISSDIAA